MKLAVNDKRHEEKEGDFFVVYMFPGGSEDKVSACNAGDPGLIPGLGRSPGEGNGNLLQCSWRRKWQPTPVFLPGESHGQRSLAGYSPRGCEESDTTERLHFHQATVHEVAKSRTRLSDFTFTFTFNVVMRRLWKPFKTSPR